MSTNYTAHTILGVKIKYDKLFRTEEQRTCDCQIGTSVIANSNFCPACGQPLFEEVKIAIDLSVEDGYYEDKCFGLYLIRTYEEDYAYIGINLGSNSIDSEENKSFYRLPEQFNQRKYMREILEPHGLWDERKFGIWTILDVS